MKTVILTEKPSVARDFAQALNVRGNGGQDGFMENESYIITWAVGHLLSPFDPEEYDAQLKKWSMQSLPIIPKEFKYKILPKTKKQFDAIKKILKRDDVDKLIVATDAGREGELIARLIINEVKFKKTSFRFWTSAALTSEVIKTEMKKIRPLKEYDRLYLAGISRQKVDWLVGMNFSRLATLKFNDLFSIGRVQTAVLSLLVEKRKSIDNFKPEDYFELKSAFEFSKGIVNAYWYDPKKKEDEKRIDKKEILDAIAKKVLNKPAKITLLTKEEKKLYPQGLYSLTELQRQANIQYGLSASKTLEIAQSLYEKYKCLSYPRTDSKVMATSSFDLVKSLVNKFQESHEEYFEKFEPYKVSLKNKVVFDDSKLTDHHGLIPLKSFNGDRNSFEFKIFDLVLRRFLSNFMKDHVYEETQLQIECEKENFKTRGKKILEEGFKVLEGKSSEEFIPNVALHEAGNCKKTEVESKKTRPPMEYTESSLLYDMTNPARLVSENELKKIFRTDVGLGTQATRAQIIETLIMRQYITREQKNLKATSKGVHLIDNLGLLPKTKTMTSVEQTASMELKLQSMAEGEMADREFIAEVEGLIADATQEWKTIQIDAFSNAKRDYSQNKNSGGKATATFKEVGECPLCKKKVIENSKAFGCSGWKEGCKFTVWKTIASKKITEAQVKKLISHKKTDLIKGFKSKTGKSFDAVLVLNQSGQTEFQFAN